MLEIYLFSTCHESHDWSLDVSVYKIGIFRVIYLVISSNMQRRQWHPTPVLLPGNSHGWRGPEGCSPWGRWGSDTTEWLHFHFSLSFIGEGNGNPLQCSCLENPRDRASWWAAVYGVAQSQTQLKWLSSSSSSVLYSRFLLVIYLIYSSVNIGEGNGIPLQYSCLEYPTDGRAWKAAVHGVAEGRTRLEWTTLSSRGSFRPGDQTLISCIGRWILYHWANREAQFLGVH